MPENNAPEAEASRREVRRLWRAWKTIHEMVHDRGYEIGEDELKMPYDNFAQKYTNDRGVVDRSKMLFSARPSQELLTKSTPAPTRENPHPTPSAGTIYVEFMVGQTIGVKDIKAFVHQCSSQNYKAGIMVTQSALSPQARKIISATLQYTQIECFMQDDLLVNITHHELVPTHVLLSKEEKDALLKRYRLKETQLPRILQKDPVARYFGLKRGQVVKIIRTSETAGRYASYRLCV